VAATTDTAQTAATEQHGRRTAQVQVTGLNKTFHRQKEKVHVLRDIDLEVADGELLVLLGPSGCGKTTLLRCLVGLERPDGGSIRLSDRTVVHAAERVFVQPNRRDVAMVFQNYALWPHMTVAKNVAFPLKSRGRKDLLREGRVEDVLKLVQCDHLADRYPPELSGGQQQRVSLARALAPHPALLLLDEPLSNLDALLRIELRAQLRNLHRRLGFTGVYVTHDQEEALALGTRVAVMRAGQFEQVGVPEEVYRRPATTYVADFLGARNRLEAVVDADGQAIIGGQRLDGFFRSGRAGTYALLFRDEDLQLRPAGGDASGAPVSWLTGGQVVEVLPGGDHAEHLVRVDENRLFVDVPNVGQRHEVDAEVEVGLDPTRTLCYDTDGNLVEGWSHVR
jgi:iron(III) transport system ATP-binding protein